MHTKKMRKVIRLFLLAYFVFCLIVGIILGEFALHPFRTQVTRLPEMETIAARFEANVNEIEIIAPDGIKLNGWFINPAKPNNDAVLLMHGVSDNRQGMIGYADLLLARGYSVLMPDSRGHGKSDGLATYGVKEKDDVTLWCEWLSHHAKPRCIYGLGESMGAAIMLQAINKAPFCSVVAESPFSSFREIAYLRVGQFMGTGNWIGKTLFRPAVEIAFIYCHRKYGVDLTDASPETFVAASESHTPILLIHGASDQSIPPIHSERIFKKSPNRITLWLVPHAGHSGAFGALPVEFSTRILACFARKRMT